MPSGLAFRVFPTTRAKLRKAVHRNERIIRTKPPQRCRRRGPNPPRSASRARWPAPAESERQGTTAAEAADAPATRAATTPRRASRRSTDWKPFAGSCSCRAARSLAGLNGFLPRPNESNGELDASTESAPSLEIGGLVNGDSVHRCCHQALPTPPIPLLHQTRQIQTPDLRRRPLPLRILSVGYTGAADGCPSLTSARQRERCCHRLRTTAWKRPTDVGSSRNPAATLPPRRDPYRPYQTRDSGYLRNAERADWSHYATRLAPDETPRKPRRASSAPATSHVSPVGTSNLGVGSRRIAGVATFGADQRANRCTTEPDSTGSRSARAEARPLRSPASPGGLDASADTNRRVCDCRLDTTDPPHEVRAGGVATTVPAGAAREVLGVR